ncbi:MAG TPA: nucleotide exchange factor GrpE [bacterium]|jgi:molecular chaperone GrpE|nr:nucleotide exchange factor GrpE [bacterium]HOL54520.1 nucleotide exchange factor GrpE [bacterium]HON72159.1 nucleotide exchange factor GrpE [bacterium]HPC76847.1 nucleotide exchange factor GrpE [bacterium]HPO81553.1 nucleotide exchange factor GrpE [bacterium]
MEEELKENLPAEDIAMIKEQYKELEDKFLRLAADFDNYRKRMAREIEELKDVIRIELIRSLLPLLDDIERAFSSIPADRDDGIRDGIEMIMKNFQDWLTSQGVKTIEISDDIFDPKYHEVVVVEEDENIDKDKVEELRTGYTLNDRVIRPTMVKIIKKVKEGN